MILDLTIHDIDYLRWLFGDVERVYAKTTHGRTTAHLEWAFILLRFKNGVMAHVEGSWANYPGEFYTTLEIAGEGGMVSYDSRKTQPIHGVSIDGGPVAVNGSSSVSADSPYYLELKDMVDAILEDRPPRVTVEDALATLKVTLAAVESARTGQVVEL